MSDLHNRRVYQPNPEFAKNARIKSMDEYHALQDKASNDYEGFWSDYAKEKITWIEPFTNTLDESNFPFVKWFDGGKLNVAEQCIDRHLDTRGDKTAILFEGDRGDVEKITYTQLYKNVNKFSMLFAILKLTKYIFPFSLGRTQTQRLFQKNPSLFFPIQFK